MQAELGEEAARLHRQELNSSKKRDRAIASIPNFRDGEDVEDFILTAERRLKAGEVNEEEWVMVVASKLSGKMGCAWQDICASVNGYHNVKEKLLKVCGYTLKLAAEVFYGFRSENSKGMTADQLYHRGLQLFRRMVAPHRVSEAAEFAILRGWVSAGISKKARASLDARAVTNAAELVDALQDHLILEGERTEGQAAIFKKVSVEPSRERVAGSTCYKCGKSGHRAFECWAGKSNSGSFRPAAGSGSGPPKVTCYTCGEVGHKSPQCTKGVKIEKGVPKDVKPGRPLRRIWKNHPTDVQLSGKVNGKEVPVLLDSGATISVVPKSMVTPEQMTGSMVAVKPFGSRKPLLLPTATVPFHIGTLDWAEHVAVAPWEEDVESEVLYSLNLKSQRGLELVLLANKLEQREVLRVTTRAQAKENSQREKEEAREIAVEMPTITPVPDRADRVDESHSTPATISPVEGKVGHTEGSIEAQSTGDGKIAEDRPVDRVPEPVANSTTLGELREKVGSLGRVEEESVEGFLAEELDASVEGAEMKFTLRDGNKESVELSIPPVKSGNPSRTELVEQTKADPSLEGWRKLADSEEQGFKWCDGLLYQKGCMGR